MITARLAIRKGRLTLDVDLALEGTAITGVFGWSGSGKTTFLRALAGFEKRHARGFVEVGGQVWQDDEARRFVPPHKRRVGYVTQESALFPFLSVNENLLFAAKRSGLSRERSRLDGIIDAMGLGDMLARAPADLSGGERQRVAIARALCADPAVLLLDEPVASLDKPARSELLEYLARFHAERQIPMVYVSHEPGEQRQIASRVALLESGRLTRVVPAEELQA